MLLQEKYLKRLAFLILFFILALRAFSDHSMNFHYTGDHGSEGDLIAASQNFARFGYTAMHFMPSHWVPALHPTLDLKNPIIYYTHFGPLPYLFISVIYNFFGQTEFFPRLVVVAISLIGLWYAIRAIKLWLSVFEADRKEVFYSSLILLALTPSFICFADTLYEQPITEALKWMSLYWALLALNRKAPLWIGIALTFAFIWISFAWWIPMAAILVFVIGCRERSFTNREAIKKYILAATFGFALPLALRFLHNTLALGGITKVASDLIEIGKIRMAITKTDRTLEFVEYSGARHFVKFLLGTYWFVGLAPFLIIAAALKEWKTLWFKTRAEPKNSMKSRYFQFFILWGICSFSWQLIMRNHGYAHAFTYLHPANFILLLAAISAALLWQKKSKLVVSLLMVNLFFSGATVTTEVWLPFVRSTTTQLTTGLCEPAQTRLKELTKASFSSIALRMNQNLQTKSGRIECTTRDRIAEKLLLTEFYTFKSSSY